MIFDKLDAVHAVFHKAGLGQFTVIFAIMAGLMVLGAVLGLKNMLFYRRLTEDEIAAALHDPSLMEAVAKGRIRRGHRLT